MKGYLLLFLFTLLVTTEGKNTVNGTIEKDPKWLHSNLSVRPAITASISYRVKYPTSWTSVPIIKFYYNGQNSTDLPDRCIRGLSGQLFNKDMAVPLVEGYGSDRKIRALLSRNYSDNFSCTESSCITENWGKFSTTRCEYWSCHGQTKIKDFDPKSYSFSLGFECDETKASLRGMQYEVTIDNESNKTRCVDLNSGEKEQMDRCGHLDDALKLFLEIPSKICLGLGVAAGLALVVMVITCVIYRKKIWLSPSNNNHAGQVTSSKQENVAKFHVKKDEISVDVTVMCAVTKCKQSSFIDRKLYI